MDVLDLHVERRTVTEAVPEVFGAVSGGEHHVIDAYVPKLRQLVIDERNSGGREHRLRRPDGQRSQSGAPAADEQYCLMGGRDHGEEALPVGIERRTARD